MFFCAIICHLACEGIKMLYYTHVAIFFRKIGIETISEVKVLYHPQTRKHLGMAICVFESVADARKFVAHNHEQVLMGNVAMCFCDTVCEFF